MPVHDPCASVCPPCSYAHPMLVCAPPCWCMPPCAAARPPCWCVPPARTGDTEEQHPWQQELSIVERWRAVRLYRGRGKTAASVMQSCGPPLYFQTSQPRLGVFLVCSTRPGSSSPAEQQPVAWMASPPQSGSETFCCSSSPRGRRALPCQRVRSLQACGNVQTM